MFEFDYKIIRKKRKKNITISVKNDRRVIVTSNFSVSEPSLLKILGSKSKWIMAQLDKMPKGREEIIFQSGQEFLIFGKKYQLSVIDSKKNFIHTIDSNIISGFYFGDKTEIEKSKITERLLIQFCKEKAFEIIAEKIKKVSVQIGKIPNKIRIQNCRTKWGSASTRGNLNFNWKIILAPEKILDYLIYHEMCHLIYPNHSKDYYNFLDNLFPERKEADRWLKKNGNLLELLPLEK